MEIIFFILSGAAIIVMFYALYQAFSLRKRVPGGKVKSTWNLLAWLILLFAVGYLSTPFFRMLSPESKDMIVGIIFLAGGIFVVIVIKLFYKIIEDVGL